MQLSFFGGTNKFIINQPIRLIELFGGIGCQASALERLGVEFEHYRMCDFDKYAVQSYNAIHGTNFVPSDITKITAEDLGIAETDKYCYIMTYSFPCTDLSVAGKGAGMSRDSGTRSGLLWEVERLLKECKELPQVLLMENVPQVHGKKNIDSFNEWCAFLENKGYKNYWKDLNAKNYGIPQNRNRTFMVSLLGDYCYEFPEPFELKLRLKDMLEDNVDEKYYLSDKAIKFVTDKTRLQKKYTQINGDIALCHLARNQTNWCGDMVAEPNLKTQLCNKLIEENRVQEFDVIRHNYSNSRLEDKREIAETNNISPTLDTRCDCLGVVVNEKNLKTKNKRLKSMLNKIDVSQTQAIDMYNQTILKEMNTIKTTIDTSNMTAITQDYRIRKLTAKECWRLMGLTDEQFDKAKASGVSNSQLYKQAGNGIVVNVLMAIFNKLGVRE